MESNEMMFCCEKIINEIAYLPEADRKNHSIVYDKNWRVYTIIFKDYSKGEEVYLTEINFCPWCGAELPSDLTDKWFDVLEGEYGITDPQDTEYNKVPAEFRTDEWWKKRGL